MGEQARGVASAADRVFSLAQSLSRLRSSVGLLDPGIAQPAALHRIELELHKLYQVAWLLSKDLKKETP